VSTESGQTQFYVPLDETLLCKANFEGEQVSANEVVPGTEFDSHRFTFQFTEKSDSGTARLLLAARSQQDRPIQYDLGMQLPGQVALVCASSCPLCPRLWVFEIWPHLVEYLEISNIRVATGNGFTSRKSLTARPHLTRAT
jgi:hypothetical protein